MDCWIGVRPVISVDTKKKELIGEYKNAGSDYRPQGAPIDVNVHDFVDKELGKPFLWRLRCRRERRVCQRRRRSRHRRICGQ